MFKQLTPLFFLALTYLLYGCSQPPRMPAEEQNISLRVNAKAFARAFVETKNWKAWWPVDNGGEMLSAMHFRYNGADYRVTEKRLNAVVLSVSEGSDSLQAALLLLPEKQDSVIMNWKLLDDSAASRSVKWTKKINTHAQALLGNAKAYYSVERNLYTFPVQKIKVADSLLISKASLLAAYPTADLIYRWIDELKAYATQQAATQTGFPMLNVTPMGNGRFKTRVAIPVNKRLPNKGDIEFQWMLGGGNILVSEVRGGPSTVNNAFAEMDNYLSDHNLVAPAIPFQSLVTDRRAEPDTIKWVTRLYWPVM